MPASFLFRGAPRSRRTTTPRGRPRAVGGRVITTTLATTIVTTTAAVQRQSAPPRPRAIITQTIDDTSRHAPGASSRCRIVEHRARGALGLWSSDSNAATANGTVKITAAEDQVRRQAIAASTLPAAQPPMPLITSALPEEPAQTSPRIAHRRVVEPSPWRAPPPPSSRGRTGRAQVVVDDDGGQPEVVRAQLTQGERRSQKAERGAEVDSRRRSRKTAQAQTLERRAVKRGPVSSQPVRQTIRFSPRSTSTNVEHVADVRRRIEDAGIRRFVLRLRTPRTRSTMLAEVLAEFGRRRPRLSRSSSQSSLPRVATSASTADPVACTRQSTTESSVFGVEELGWTHHQLFLPLLRGFRGVSQAPRDSPSSSISVLPDPRDLVWITRRGRGSPGQTFLVASEAESTHMARRRPADSRHRLRLRHDRRARAPDFSGAARADENRSADGIAPTSPVSSDVLVADRATVARAALRVSR